MLPASVRRILALFLIAVGLILAFGIAHSLASGTQVANSKPKVSSSKATRSALPSGKWKRVFDDEFNGTSLNRSKWYPGCQFGSSVTFYCVNTADPSHTCFRPRGIKVANGMLTLTIVKQKIVCNNGKTYPYASGFVDTTHLGLPPRFRFRYGFMEARIRMPSSQRWSWVLAGFLVRRGERRLAT